MEIGEFLKSKRLAKNFSQRQLALYSGVSNAAISRIERGEFMPKMDVLEKLSKTLDTPLEDFMVVCGYLTKKEENPRKKGIKIPVLGEVAAGIPLDAIEDIIDYEEIPEDLAKTGDFFGLRIKGDSMSPRMLDGDVVIVRKQSDVESGEIAIVLVNGDSATCKKVVKHDNGITLIANNPAVYEPHFFTMQEVDTLPIKVIGKVVELRGKF